MGHVFISYASENADEANELVALIESKGVTAWIAPRDVRPGFDYSEELQRALETCAAFVVIVTEPANSSPYVRAETEMAFSNNKPMLPVRLAQIAAGPGLAFFLKIRSWTDAFGPKREKNLARLVLELQTLTGKAPSWAPKVGPPASPLPPAPAAPPPLAADPVAAPAPRPAPSWRIWALVGGMALVLAVAAALLLLTRRPQPLPAPGPQANNNINPAPAPPAPTPAPTARSYAQELADFGVAPKSELETNVGSPTPLAIPVGVRVTTEEAQRLLADNRATPVDVLGNAHQQTLPGALYMPAGGMPGSFFDASQQQFVQQLGQATGGDTARPLLFFCLGAACWESYNAMLRANAAGYTQLYWYRGGLAAWQEAGLPMQALSAVYGSEGQ